MDFMNLKNISLLAARLLCVANYPTAWELMLRRISLRILLYDLLVPSKVDRTQVRAFSLV